jgi:hypothetical protein
MHRRITCPQSWLHARADHGDNQHSIDLTVGAQQCCKVMSQQQVADTVRELMTAKTAMQQASGSVTMCAVPAAIEPTLPPSRTAS